MRQEGVLFVNWVPLVKIVPSSDGSATLEWNEAFAAELQVDNDQVNTELGVLAASSNSSQGMLAKIAAVQWSV